MEKHRRTSDRVSQIQTQTETGFQNAMFIKDKTAENIWTYFLNCWAMIYTVFPESIILDQEYSFSSAQFRKGDDDVGIHLRFSLS